MAAIGSIRKHSGLLIGIIGSAMLLFVLGGALESSSTFFNGPNDEIGEINGNKISYQDFETKVAEIQANSRGGQSDEERKQIRDQVWNNMLKDLILGKEYEALGLTVTDEELLNIIKNESNNPSLKQYFTDPQTGQIVQNYANPDGSLNGNAVIEYLKQVVYADGENSAEALASWNNFQENYVRKPAVDNKYAMLIAKGVYITDVELERKELDQNSRISFNYVGAFFNDTPDESIKVTEDELRAYYNAHKSEPEFEQKELTSSIEFVTFEVAASDEDKANLKAELADLRTAFESAESDTLFINENGDTPFNIKWRKDGMFPPMYDTTITAASVGTVVGPFLNLDKFQMVKVLDKQMRPDSVMASHILMQVENNNIAATRAIIDSLKTEVENGAKFEDLATEFSVDPGSAAKGGDLGWFVEGQMVPTFNDACFEGKVGDLVVVNSQFGVHLIKITDQTEAKEVVLVGILDNTIEPSQASYEAAYNAASSFAITNNTPEKFTEASEGLNRLDAPNLRPDDMNLMGRPNTRKVIRWVFEAEAGTVSDAMETGDEFIVAMVTEVKEKGILPFELVEEVIKQKVINEKKAEMLAAKMQGGDINKVAQSMNTTVQPANDVAFASFSIPGLGNEQKLLGMAFSLENGQTSNPIVGDRGVYVLMVNKKDVPENVQVIDGTRQGLMAAFKSRASYEPFIALKANSDIQDNRYTFF
ncbi:SurA N-terminal domain-containing protein [bacterium SCSIO 12643]|nr:SurA N-terminal domain-containing protein [bacterium SCSIO 12643]